ncbi:MAG: metallophosphoesterase [Bacteroidetes bacterium]|nr:MAG: metallophosphoesterase [Bacteroidota bacterium]
MKRLLQFVLFIAASVLLVWILKQAFPKNTGALNLFLLFLFFDAFLWIVTRREIRPLKPVWRITLTLLFWLPFVLVIAGVTYGFFSTYYVWPLFVKTYLTSFVLIAYTARLLPVAFLIATLVTQGILLILARWFLPIKPWIRRLKFLFLAGWLLGLLFFLVMLAGMVLWEHHFRLRKVEITLEQLPPAFNGLRIVQISDLHLGGWNRISRLEELVTLVNAAQPDLVFFTGDLCNYSTADAWPFRDILKKIRATYGIFAVMGNHDYGDYMKWASAEAKNKNLLDLYRFYQELGWRLLRNENQVLVKDRDSLVLVGVENWGSERRFQRLADLPKALAGVETIPVKLLLSHDPTYWDSIVSNQYPGIDLTFSGHTHGGQMGIETGDFRWSPIQYLYPTWAGLYQKRWPEGPTQYLYVNRGAGTIGYAGRVGIWAEITLIVLKCKSS